MKHALLIYIFIFCFGQGYSQQEFREKGLVKGNCKINGLVIDKVSKSPFEYAIVSLYRQNDSIPTNGIVTNDKGFFSLENLNPGIYKIKFSFIGYENIWKDSVYLSEDKPEVFIGKIVMFEASAKLKEVEISAERSIIETGIDKRVYNVGKDVTASGGTATDILQNIPSVNIDMDRNIQLRGSGSVNILIDGRPSTLTGMGGLDQIPANSIDKIEIITNPSAKYDPDGVSGLINIITKKNQKSGFNGNASFTAGTYDKYNGSANLNYRTKKISLYTTVSGLSNYFSREGKQLRKNIFDDTSSYVNNYTGGGHRMKNYNVSLGGEYFFTRRTSLIANTLIGKRAKTGINLGYYDFLDENENNKVVLVRNSDESNNFLNYEASLALRHSFKQEGRMLNADVNYSSTAGYDSLNAEQYYSSGMVAPTKEQRTNTNRQNQILTIQVNYTHPFKSGHQLETGVKNISRKIDNDFTSEHQFPGYTPWANDSNLTNHVIYTDQVYSIYGVYTGAIKKLGYSLGSRFEQTFYSIDQKAIAQKTDLQYFSWFPSAHLKYKIKPTVETGFSYSRRINRPTIDNLNPFPEYTDPYNLMRGNPFLKPEYINSFEWQNKLIFNKFTINPTLYYRFNNNSITRYRSIDSNGVGTVTFQNLTLSRQLGLEFTIQADLAKWWNISGSFNSNYQKVDAGNLYPGLSNEGITGMFNVVSIFKPAKGFSIQLNYNYMLPFVMPQGRGKMGAQFDIGLKKEVLKDKGTITLRATDVFNTRAFNLKSSDYSFEQTSYRKRESRIVYLGFSYRFGTAPKQGPQRKGADEQAPRMDDMGGGF